MYQMNPDLPNQLYAELVQSRQQDRLAQRVARTNKRTRITARREQSRGISGRRINHPQAA